MIHSGILGFPLASPEKAVVFNGKAALCKRVTALAHAADQSYVPTAPYISESLGKEPLTLLPMPENHAVFRFSSR